MVPFTCWAELLGLEEELPERCPALCTSVKVKSKEKNGQRRNEKKKYVNNTLIVAGYLFWRRTIHTASQFLSVRSRTQYALVFFRAHHTETNSPIQN